jgi:hypothetical protein
VAIDLTGLPDFFALEHLAESLWRDGETRGAALLLGSGFSRFARLPGGDSKQPPLWDDLRKGMLDDIYAGAAETDAPADPLRLAEEFRAMLGQAALDDFIRKNVPDASWEPSELHEKLLRLPWADAGASGIRHSPRPLIEEGGTLMTKLARNPRRDREAVSQPRPACGERSDCPGDAKHRPVQSG